METTVVYWDYTGIMENTMETTGIGALPDLVALMLRNTQNKQQQ